MIISLNWLRDYVDVDMTVEEYCNGMIMSGSNIETAEAFSEKLAGIKLGKIIKIERHPDADKLVICKVNIGDEDLQIVTGAPNVYEGALVPVATHGSKVPGPLHGQEKVEGGVVIKRGKLRGVESNGMLCSCSELGFKDSIAPLDSKDGIWTLPEELEDRVGEELYEALELDDTVIDFEITPNRPDCLSVNGMARETVATFGGEKREPILEEYSDKSIDEYIRVEIKSPLCRRYVARVVEEVKIAPSPWWLQKRLMAAGVRPINNIVDATNFVMLEYGQPLHAFDIRQLEGNIIKVEMAEKGETFVTLDGKGRTLDESMLMIADGAKKVAVAGVMGGLNSEIVDDTTTVILESASFVADSIRKTSKKLGLRTEASGRYEKGITPEICDEASRRFMHIVRQIGAGKPVEGVVDIYPLPEEKRCIDVRPSRINHVLGTSISPEYMARIFESLDIKVDYDRDVMKLTPPFVRADLVKEVDFVEEVARIYGYDELDMTLPSTRTASSETSSFKCRRTIRNILVGMGYTESQTLSFISPSMLERLGLNEDDWELGAAVKLINPLGEDTSMLRSLLMPSVLEVMSTNINRGMKDVNIFEIGTTFMENIYEENSLPIEQFNLALCTSAKGKDFFHVKGELVTLLEMIGLRDVFFKRDDYCLYHPGQCASVWCKSEAGEEVYIGIMGQLHPKILQTFDIEEPCFGFELMLDTLLPLTDSQVHYEPVSKYPSTSRDIALTVDENVEAGAMLDAMREVSTEIVENIELFDIYRGEQVDEGQKSVAFRITYRDKKKTITDADVDAVHERLLQNLKTRCGAVLRDK